MLKNGIITLIGYDEAADDYVIKGTAGAWIYHRRKSSVADKGFHSTSSVTVRVELGSLAEVKKGDFIALVEMKTADIENAYKVLEVVENRYGSRPHIRIEAGEG